MASPTRSMGNYPIQTVSLEQQQRPALPDHPAFTAAALRRVLPSSGPAADMATRTTRLIAGQVRAWLNLLEDDSLRTDPMGDLHQWIQKHDEGDIMGTYKGGKIEAVRRIQSCLTKGVENLDLSELGLRSFPPLEALKTFKKIDLSKNRLILIPKEIGDLTTLYDLDLSDNKIKNFYYEFKYNTSLRRLIFSDNKIEFFSFTGENPKTLQILSLQSNQLKELPAEIGNLGEITELNVSDNLLIELPSEIGNLGKITKLNVSHNQLSQLPSEIGNLGEIEELDVSHNKLAQLPSEIGNLLKMTDLDVSDNPIKEVPPSLKSMPVLEFMGTSNTGIPWDSVPHKSNSDSESEGSVDSSSAKEGSLKKRRLELSITGDTT